MRHFVYIYPTWQLTRVRRSARTISHAMQIYLVYKPLNTTRSLLSALHRPLQPFTAVVWTLHAAVAVAAVAALLLFRLLWSQQSITRRRWLRACGSAAWEYAIAILGQESMKQRLYGILSCTLHLHSTLCADHTRHALLALIGLSMVFLPLLYEDLLLTALLLSHAMHKALALVDCLSLT